MIKSKTTTFLFVTYWFDSNIHVTLLKNFVSTENAELFLL